MDEYAGAIELVVVNVELLNAIFELVLGRAGLRRQLVWFARRNETSVKRHGQRRAKEEAPRFGGNDVVNLAN